jgi:hypothetical protein
MRAQLAPLTEDIPSERTYRTKYGTTAKTGFGPVRHRAVLVPETTLRTDAPHLQCSAMRLRSSASSEIVERTQMLKLPMRRMELIAKLIEFAIELSSQGTHLTPHRCPCMAEGEQVKRSLTSSLGRVLINAQIEGRLSGQNRKIFAHSETYGF